MSRLMISSDLHLGHKNAYKWRGGFESPEEHHALVFENLAANINKRDTLLLCGDVALDQHWLDKLSTINCVKKILVLGNHDTERLDVLRFREVFDEIHGLLKLRKIWFSHCPVHPAELRGCRGNIHGHVHEKTIDDDRYFNACLENTAYAPVSFQDILHITGWNK